MKFGIRSGAGNVALDKIVIGGARRMISIKTLVVSASAKSASTVGSSIKSI
jgi:hypothetical protein